MPDPAKHGNERNWFESLLRWIPGFRGYLAKEDRRSSDQLTRQWISERLERSKSGLNDYARGLVERGKLAEIGECDRLRMLMDKVIGRFRSAPAGYSGLFDWVKVREERLDAVYAHDVGLMQSVESAAQGIEGLRNKAESAALLIPPLVDQLNAIDRGFDARADLLSGLES